MSAQPDPVSSEPPEVLARGPWRLDQVKASWRTEEFEPSAKHTQAADAAIDGLRERGSPSHDGVAARLVDFRADADGIAIELQPLRWALRLVAGDASRSIAAGEEDKVTPDEEHDEFAWWPREIDDWPPEAGEALPRMARWLGE